MNHATTFAIPKGLHIVLRDLGVRPGNLLRRAGLPLDLLSREHATLPPADYFGLWRALEAETGDATLPIRIGSAIQVEAFDPPLFAALCSPDLRVAFRRIGRHKRLIGPMTLDVAERADGTTVTIGCLDDATLPETLAAFELVFVVRLVRLATREPIRPLRVTSIAPPAPAGAYRDYFGVAILRGANHAVTFSATDSARPFLTVNDGMWRFFEPELRRRLVEVTGTAETSERVRAALLELLPVGRASIEAAAGALGLGTRTLQRRLGAEDTSFQRVLGQTRERLARHYLHHSEMSGAEISFLLGYEDPNSFFRAFRDWTGETPEHVRSATRSGG